MSKPIKILRIVGVFLSLLWLAACGSPAPTETPTPDLNPFRTEVAATVYAQVTHDLALTPSATLIPSATPTIIPLPTHTLAPTVTPGATLTATQGVTTIQATATPVTATVNLAEWVSQTIADDSVFAPGEAFTITWRLKNVGTSTWTETYMLRFFSGNAFGAPVEVPLEQEVLPGATIDISLKMKAPALPGDYRTDWVLSTESRSNFKQPVFLKIKVVIPPTPTRTPTSTPTPTT